MTSLSNKLLLMQPNTNTDHTTKKNDFMSFHENLNNEFKLGGSQTKNNVTILAPAYRSNVKAYQTKKLGKGKRTPPLPPGAHGERGRWSVDFQKNRTKLLENQASKNKGQLETTKPQTRGHTRRQKPPRCI